MYLVFKFISKVYIKANVMILSRVQLFDLARTIAISFICTYVNKSVHIYVINIIWIRSLSGIGFLYLYLLWFFFSFKVLGGFFFYRSSLPFFASICWPRLYLTIIITYNYVNSLLIYCRRDRARLCKIVYTEWCCSKNTH